MKPITREQVKKLFPKVKKINFPDDFDHLAWNRYFFYLWEDLSSKTVYFLTDIRGSLESIRFEIVKLTDTRIIAQCDIAQASDSATNIALVSTQVKGYTHGQYVSKGKYISLDVNWIHDIIGYRMGVERYELLLREWKYEDLKNEPQLKTIFDFILNFKD